MWLRAGHVQTGRVEELIFRSEGTAPHMRLQSIEDPTARDRALVRTEPARVFGDRQAREWRTLLLDYSAEGRIVAVSFLLPDGTHETLLRYEYDSAGRLAAAVDARGHADRYGGPCRPSADT